MALTRIVIWFSLPSLALLAVLLVWRRAVREFPYFFTYVLMGECVDIARYWGYYRWRQGYPYVFWVTDVLIAVFTFLVAYELFIRRLFPRFHATRFYRYLFPIVGLFIGLVAAPSALAAEKISLLLGLVHGLEILRVTVLLFFVGLMVLMGRRWTRYEFAIALGLALQAAATLVTSANWTRSFPMLPNNLPLIAYDLACLVWLIAFLRPEKPTAIPVGPVSPAILEGAKEWESALKESVTAKKQSG